MRAMPSPTSTTVPTERVSTPASNWSMADLMIWVMSSERMAMVRVLLWAVRATGRRRRACAQPFEATPDAAVDESVPEADLTPPRSSGSTWRLSSTRPPVMPASRARSAATSLVSGAALVTVASTMPSRWSVQAPELARRPQAAARSGRARPAAASRLRGPPVTRIAQRPAPAARRRDAAGHARVGQQAHQLRARRAAARRRSKAVEPGVERSVALGDLEGRLGVAPSGAAGAGHGSVAA